MIHLLKKYLNILKRVKLEFGIKNADIISIHAPLNSSTKNLISKKQFLKMKKTQ